MEGWETPNAGKLSGPAPGGAALGDGTTGMQESMDEAYQVWGPRSNARLGGRTYDDAAEWRGALEFRKGFWR